MQKMRVSAMKITKADGRRVEQPAPKVMERRRESLKQRLAQIEKRYRAQRERQAEERIGRSRRPGGAAFAQSRKRQGGQSGGRSVWRRDVALQTGICAVVLLSVIGFRALDTPLTNRVSDGIAQAVTMEIDLSENLGELQFVKDVLPESVLVFWQGTADAPKEFIRPLNGEITVAYTEKVSGILLAGTQADVFAAADGEVVSVTKGQEGDFVLKIRHDGGMETLYGFLQGVKVAQGERVRAGQEVGLAMPAANGVHLYFQATVDGKAVDPEPLLAQ